MKKLLVLVVGVALVGAAAYLYSRSGQAGSAEGQRARANPAKGGGGIAPAGPNPAKMDFDELCAWLTQEYEGFGSWGAVSLDKAEAALARAEAGSDRLEHSAALAHLAEILLIHGRNDESVAAYERALALAVEADAPSERTDALTLSLAMAHLRRGEASHCIEMHNSDSCLFPLTDDGVWADPTGARVAIGYFEEFLDSNPGHPTARWLLNLAHMAAGTWPDGLDPALRLPDDVVATAGELGQLGRFRDVAAEVGVATFNGAGGAILDDFDGDGLLDLVTSSMFPCEPLRVYRNRGDGTFEERTEAAGIADQLGGLNCIHGDYDGDGDLDVLVLRGAWMGRNYGRQRNSLLANDGAGNFTDVTLAAGLGRTAFATQTASFADYDLDGDLDLYIGNELFPNELYRNEGDGTFVEVAGPAGVAGEREFTKGVAWGDYDNDGYPDLHVSNWGTNLFFRNRGDGTFEDLSEELGVASHGLSGDALADAVVVMGDGNTPDDDATFPTWFFDYDNDGWLDLFAGGWSANLENIVGDYLGDELRDPRRLRIYRNVDLGDGKRGFRNLAEQLGAAHIRLPMGANYGDVDNDGWLDFYLGTGQPRFEYLLPNVLYRNVDGRAFVDATVAAGVGHLQKGHGIAFGDIDNDGDQDLMAQLGGFYPADAFQDALFLNPGNDHAWVTLVLRGARKNTRAVGARIEVQLTTPAGPRSIFRLCGSGGSFGASSLQQEIGLGRASEIQRVVVDWPGGERQSFDDVPLNSFVELVEGRAEAAVLERPVLQLGD